MSDKAKPLKRPRGLLKSKKEEPSLKRQKQDAEQAIDATERTDVTLEDWDDLKELFDNALEALDGNQTPAAAASLFRGVIHECDRFIRNLPNPNQAYDSADPPYAFATLYGSATYNLGSIFAEQPELITDGEPVHPMAYFEATCNIFDSIKDLPAKAEPNHWRARLELTWGQAILAAHTSQDGNDAPGTPGRTPLHSAISHLEIGVASLVPPGSEPLEYSTLSLNRTRMLLEATNDVLSAIQDDETNIEDLKVGCGWILSALENESGDTSLLNLTRGKSWLALGSRLAEQVENALDPEDEDAEIDWGSDDAKSGREALSKAVDLLRAVIAASNSDDERAGELKEEAGGLVGEALLSLANLTEEEARRETLYAQAKEHGVDVDAMQVDGEDD